MKEKTLWAVIIILLLLVCVMAFLFFHSQDISRETTAGVVYEPNQSEQQIQAGTSLPGVSIPGWTSIALPAGMVNAEVSLHNPKENAGFYDLQFSLKLAETDEVIFQTGLIEPGYCCNRVQLSRELEPGEYRAVLFVQPYRRDSEQTPTNNANLELKLIVQ